MSTEGVGNTALPPEVPPQGALPEPPKNKGGRPKGSKNKRGRSATKPFFRAKNETQEKVRLKYSMLPHQKLFAEHIENGKRVVLLLGGIRSGKTYAGAWESIKQIYKYCRKPNLGWIVSPTYPMSLITERAFEEAAGDLIIKKYRGERAYLLYPNKGSNVPYRVEIKSAENPDRLRGAGLGFIWCDEAAYYTEETWKVLLGRVLDTQGIIFLTTTPRGKNWIYDKIYTESERNPLYAVVKAKTLDNKYLASEDVSALRSQYSSEFAKQELEAEFVSFEGLVYKGFDFRRHVVPPFTDFPQNAEMVGSLDFGYADPFVHLWIMKMGGRFYIVDEYYEKFRTVENHSIQIKTNRWDKYVSRRWADPSGAQECADLLRYGIGTHPARNDLRAGIDSVSRMFEQNRLYITSNCLNTLKELAEYHYPSRDGRNSGEDPVDFANHTMDAMRYGIYSEENYAKAHPFITVEDSGEMHVHQGDLDPLPISRWNQEEQYNKFDFIEPQD